MVNTLTGSLPKEGDMGNLTKIHMSIIIALLAFSLTIVGFFLVKYIDRIDSLDTKINSLEVTVNLIANDTTWIKNSLIQLHE